MKVTYSHANPKHGNESFLIRFHQKGHLQTPVLLVDSGNGVDISQQLGEDEYLLGILLTHAHSDHYQTLPQNLIDGAKVYTSPDTALVLPDVIRDGIQNGVKGSVSTVTDALVPIEDWHNLLNNVRVKPIPAGHCPGAAGFLVQFESDGEWQTIVITGDFTLSNAAGYPGFPIDMLVNADALFLTGTANSTDERAGAIEAAYEHAQAGSRTLLTTTGLLGVELAYQMGHLFDQNDISIPIRIVGHGAKLYNKLGYDVPQVTAIETFKRTEPVMEAGGITISGPQSPTEGSSGRLFGAIRNDPNAALIQVMNNGAAPVREGRCTIHSFEYIAHPTQDEIDEVVETLDPIQVIITHQSQQSGNRYKDKYTSYVWAPSDTNTHELFNRSKWQAPPWVTQQGNQLITSHHRDAATNAVTISGDVPTPSISHTGEFTASAEGYDDSAFELLRRSNPTYSQSSAASNGSENAVPIGPADIEPDVNEAQVTEADNDEEVESEPATTSADGAEEVDTGSSEVDDSPTVFELDARLIDAGDGQALLKLDDAEELLESVSAGATVNVRIAPN
jgi:putative mRNA 3-end processing factor